MGPVIEKITFFVFVLPYLIIMEGIDMLKRLMKKENRSWDKLLYFILFLLCIIFIVLWIFGYR